MKIFCYKDDSSKFEKFESFLSNKMLILFSTGFLRMNWMNKHHIIAIIEEKTDVISKEIMTEIATSIR